MTDDSQAESGNAASDSLAADPATVFTALADLIYRGSDPTQMYAAICVAATLLVPDCDHASLLLQRKDRFVTVGASDRLAQQVHELERRADDRPCVDAIKDVGSHSQKDLTTPSRWREFAAPLCEQTPIRAAMAFELRIDKHQGAALNLFSDTAVLSDTEAGKRASLLASFASVALTALHRGGDAAHLRRGLMSNRKIGTALGLLMMLQDLDEDAAFDLLRRRSQDLNIKLAEVAQRVIAHRGLSTISD